MTQKILAIYITLCYILLVGEQMMCVLKNKLQSFCDWIKILVFIGGVAGTVIIYISSVITIPNKVNDHEIRISKMEKDLNDIKIDTIAKLTSLQEDVRLIKEVLIKRQ